VSIAKAAYPPDVSIDLPPVEPCGNGGDGLVKILLGMAAPLAHKVPRMTGIWIRSGVKYRGF
jgi:hypothetical protein